jgi:hypothetical protein
MRAQSLPLLTFDVDATPAGAERASGRLAGFATEHGVARGVRERLTAVAADVVGGLAGGSSRRARLQIEADIGDQDLQVVVSGSADAEGCVVFAALCDRLEPIGDRCDGFATEPAGAAGFEVWCRFSLQ